LSYSKNIFSPPTIQKIFIAHTGVRYLELILTWGSWGGVIRSVIWNFCSLFDLFLSFSWFWIEKLKIQNYPFNIEHTIDKLSCLNPNLIKNFNENSMTKSNKYQRLEDIKARMY
jgi:hypothetical protein